MSTTGQNIKNLINQWIRNYAVTAFHDMRLNTILNLIVQWIDGIFSGSVTIASVVPVTSADFTDATNCPLTALNGQELEIFWNEGQRFIYKDTEWSALVGGGFEILMDGFDSTDTTYHFYIYPR
jgi:hypothetical protein